VHTKLQFGVLAQIKAYGQVVSADAIKMQTYLKNWQKKGVEVELKVVALRELGLVTDLCKPDHVHTSQCNCLAIDSQSVISGMQNQFSFVGVAADSSNNNNAAVQDDTINLDVSVPTIRSDDDIADIKAKLARFNNVGSHFSGKSITSKKELRVFLHNLISAANDLVASLDDE